MSKQPFSTWSRQEEDVIIEEMKKGNKYQAGFERAAQRLDGRTVDACAYRWYQHIKPRIDWDEFQQEVGESKQATLTTDKLSDGEDQEDTLFTFLSLGVEALSEDQRKRFLKAQLNKML